MKSPDSVWLGRAAVALSWAVYLPVISKYTVWLATVVLCAVALRSGRGMVDFWRQPSAAPALLLVAWLALSAAWSPAPATVIASHFGLYILALSLPVVAAALPPAAAAAALRHFCAASGLVALLLVLDHAGVLPPSLLWRSTVDAEGNNRIANSMMLALGAAFSLWQATRSTRIRPRLGWVALAALIALGLSMQDRRTGIVVLPFALLAWALAAQVGWRRRVAVVLGMVACMGLAWQVSDNVRARFAEGLAELRHYEPVDTVANSWGQRLRMFEITAAMVRERPLAGHGIGSWQQLWRQRTTPGTMLNAQTTPHNEYLLLAQQAGGPAVLLLLWLVVAAARSALRAGALGMPSLMLWTTFACAACFNVIFRDARFSLPLLMLAACCAAAQRGAEGGPRLATGTKPAERKTSDPGARSQWPAAKQAEVD